jgi:DNA-binding MarR family transcriptional regulator
MVEPGGVTDDRPEEVAMQNAITFPVDPDLSDVRAMVLGTIEAAGGDSLTVSALASRFGLPMTSVAAALRSLVASGLVIPDEYGYASTMQLLD